MEGEGIRVVPVRGRVRGQLAHALDGRYGAMNPRMLTEHARRLVDASPLDGVDVVLGIPEGGSAPSFAFAQQAGLPLVLASRFDNESSHIRFREPHCTPPHDRFTIQGLERGQQVLLVEDEVTTGHTVVECVRALRAEGVVIAAVATFLAVDNPAMRKRLDTEGIGLIVGRWLPVALLQTVRVEAP